jgi:3-isopropylmalate/(R)-2-methylmalate dehydratase large subunit
LSQLSNFNIYKYKIIINIYNNMGMTITEKIIAEHSDITEIRAGQFVYADVDICLGNDITAPIAIEQFETLDIDKVFNPEGIVLVPDHFTPNKDIKSAQNAKLLREFAQKHRIKNYFEVGRVGIEHALLPEKGIVVPGDLVIGADSHTCTYGAMGIFSTGVGSTDLAACYATGKVWLKVPETIKFVFNGELNKWVSGKDLILYVIGRIGVDGAGYKAMEFSGPVITDLSMDDRLAMCNMAIEAGAKNGIIEPDDCTEEYINDRAQREYKFYTSDTDCEYLGIHEYDISSLSPQVALPNLPENTRPVEELSDVQIDQVVIGLCTNGRISDLRVAAQILKDKKN